MPEEVVFYVTRYGYIAIFLLVFLQEIGMPNPVPNELLLMFLGYLSFRCLLSFTYVLLVVVSADFIGTNILYFLFYNTGTFLIRKKPRWFPLSERVINRLSVKISAGGKLSLFIFRLTPFTRGYASVIAGLLRVKPKIFLPVAFISALIWACVYVETGRLIGPSWDLFTRHIQNFKYILIAVPFAVLFAIIIYFMRKGEKNNSTAGIINSRTS